MKPKMWWFKRSSWPHLFARWLMLFATTGYVFLPTSVVWANPTGEQVVGGSATFDRQGNTLTVNQATDRLAVNWQDFSIAAGERTHFNMPSAASIALNRVLGGNPSQIYGTLSSNGNIILVNNAGIFAGSSGVVNAASFVGSTMDIDPGQFMAAGAGGYHLHGDSYAPIVNQGNITAEKGDVFLIAQKVENRGTISAPNGRAALVGVGRAADRTEVVLHEVGGSGFAVRIAQLEGEAAQGMNGDLPDGEELLNEGEIAAAQAELNASGNIYALAIKNSGIIKAKAVLAQADGTVRLDGGLGDVRNTGTLIAKNAGDESTAAGGKIEVTGQNVTASPESIITAAGGVQGGDGGKVKIDSADTTIVQGKVDVAAPSAGAKGGKVELLGEKVGLFEGAKVNASGGAGGGTVLAGGDYLGGNQPAESLRGLVELEDEAVKNAKATVMAETAEIKADATVNGDGGKIILWSDEYTGFFGKLFARGGAEGGDGGFVETSSKINLQAFGDVSVKANLGLSGLWLLDPLNVTIVATGGTTIPGTGGTFFPTTANAQVNAGSIVTAIQNANDVTITTFGSETVTSGTPPTTTVINQDGDINVGAAITIAAGQPAYGSLTLTATRNIAVNAAINFGNATASIVTLETGTAGGISGGGQITLNPIGGLRLVSGSGGTSVQINNPLVLGAAGGIAAVSTGNISIAGTATSVIPVVTIGGTIGISTPGNIDLIGQTAILGGSTLIGANVNIFADADFQFESDRFAGAVQTTQRQRYQGAVTFTQNTVLSSGQDIVFRSTVDGPGEVILIVGRQTDLIDLVGSLAPLGAFRQEGGLINFYAEGTALVPSMQVTGSATFDSANLVLWENTFLLSANDVIFGGDINSSFFDVPAVFNVTTTAGNIIFDGQVGSAAALGNLTVNAGGNGQIALNRGATTLPGASPVSTGANGNISLTTSGASIVTAGTIDTRGGLSIGSVIGGDLSITAGGAESNIQLEGNLVTRGGTITFNSPVFISSTATIDNTLADKTGTITFGDSPTDTVFLEGNLTLSSGADVIFLGDLNGAGVATITVQNGKNLILNGNVGNTTPLGGLTVRSGSGDILLANDISTGGGAVSFGMRVRLGDNVSIDTTKLNNANGNTTEFLQGVIGTEVSAGSFVTGKNYLITNLGNTSFTAVGATAATAGNFRIGQEYIITSVGTTSQAQWNAIAGTSGLTYAAGSIFTAKTSGAGSGTGATLLTFFTASGLGAGNGKANELYDLTVNTGIVGRVGFGSSAQAPNYSAQLNSLTVFNAGTFSVTSALQGYGKNSRGFALEIFPELNAATPGAANVLQSNGDGGIILRNGINTSFLTAEAGDVIIRSFGTGTVRIDGSVVMNGGSNILGTIGFDGGDLLIDSRSSFIMPGAISSVGGIGTFVDGKAGNVTVDTSLGSTADISFSTAILDVIQDSQYTLRAGRNFYLGVLDSGGSQVTGGVVLQLNRTSEGADFALASRGSITVGFGGSAENGYFYAPSGSAILTYGGNVTIDRLSGSTAPTYDPNDNIQAGGVNFLGQLFTTANGLASGSVKINKSDGVIQGVVSLGGVFTRGGVAAEDTVVGLQGGLVDIKGSRVDIGGRIDTRGSDSLNGGADQLGIGGAGGSINIEGATIVLSRDLISTGGRGISTLSGIGGGGGFITMTGDVELNSRVSDLTTIVVNTRGGNGLGIGDEGPGGAISFFGKITGTPTTSNILDLQYGSGEARLGDAAADTITLGTLITAADDAGSTGSLVINGTLNVDTLTTFGRGYGISILGNGSQITQNVSFLNTGVVALGSAGGTVTFTGGFDAASGATAPASVQLAGTIVSGPGTGAGMLMDTVVLAANTSLNSNNNAIQMGAIDGAFGLTLLSGIAGSSVEIGGVVGGTTRLGAINVETGLTQVLFSQAVNATSFTTASGSSTTLEGNLNLTGAVNLGGTTTLRSVDEDAALAVTTSGGTISGNLVLEESGGDGVSISSSGALEVSGGVSGAVNLALAGAGAKTFSGTVNVGSGSGASLSIGGGAVSLTGLTTASGLSSTTADVVFNGAVVLGKGDTVTTLNRNVTFNNATFTSTDDVFFGDDGADAITLLGGLGVGGDADYTFSGAVNGVFGITLDGAGSKTFEGEVGTGSEITGFTQVAGSGLVVFEGNVETSAGNDFAGSVTLSGISFLAGGATVLGDSSTDTIILNTAGVTLRGAGAYTVNGALTGAQTLTLDDAGTKTFASTANIGGFTQVDGTGLATFQGNVTTSGASTFNSRVTLSGISFSAGGATILGNAAGDTITLTTGAVTLAGDVAGAFTVNGAVTGAQALTLTGSNTKTFTSTVTVGNGITAMTQANTAGNDVSFAENVTLNGASTFARQVTLDGMTVTASGATRLNTLVLSGGAVTLQGAGVYTTSGAVAGAQDFTLSGSGTKTFASTINSASLTQTGGQIRLGGDVTTGVVDLENAATTSAVLVNSGGLAQTYDALTLGGNLTAQSGAGLATLGMVGGAGNLSLLSDAVDLLAAVRNQGLFSAQTAGLIDLGGAYLTGVEVARIFSSGGASFTSTGAGVTANTVVVNTGLSLNGATGAGVTDTTVNGALNMVTGGVATFNGTLTTARSLGINAASIASDGTADLLDLVSVPTLGNVTLTGGGANFAYLPVGNLTLTGRITLNNGDVVLAPTGNFVNSFNGNPFTGATTRILTQDFFSYPNSAGVVGLTPVFGVTSVLQLGANQIGVAKDLLAGSAGPFITEFTTGTGQPYILATQENAVPGVMMPATYTVSGAFPARVSYSAEELEMMTPEERSAYEAGVRRQSARVILERQPGQSEVGVPAEGEIPQAKAPAPAQPAPTAQVILDGKPLAGRSDKEKGDSSQLLRIRPAKAVALRPEMDVQGVMEGERMAAEVNVGSAPVAGTGR